MTGFLPRGYPSTDGHLIPVAEFEAAKEKWHSERQAAAQDAHLQFAAERERLLALLAEASEALRTFAAYADKRNTVSPSFVITPGPPMAKRQLTMGDCYQARATRSRLDAALAADPSAKG